MPIIAIPDIHGDFEQFSAVLNRARREYEGARFVLLGDYIDRGPDSASVLQTVHTLAMEGHATLAGNHEELLMGFLSRDVSKGFNFAVAGGGETIASFAEAAGREFKSPEELKEYLNAEELLDWLQSLPHAHQQDGVSFTHAPVPRRRWRTGAEPARELCLWSVPASKGDVDLEDAIGAPPDMFAACGHVIMDFGADGVRRPATFARGVYLDCGCGSKEDGRLVAGVFEDGKLVEFCTASGRERAAKTQG